MPALVQSRAGTLKNDSQWEWIVQSHAESPCQSPEVPVVFLLRLSAIGDVIIAASTARWLVMRGLRVVFVTTPDMQQVVETFAPEVNDLCLCDGDQPARFLVRDCAGQWHNVSAPQVPWSVLDVHCTARSRRALSMLRKVLCVSPRFVLRVQKRGLQRVALIALSRLALRRRPRTQGTLEVTQTPTFPSIHNLQRQAAKILDGLLSSGSLTNTKPACSSAEASVPTSKSFPEAVMQPGYVLFFPGASLPLKAIPDSFLNDLVSGVLARTSYEVLLSGGPLEAAQCESLVRCSGSERVRSLAGQTDLAGTFSLIQNASYVVTGDSFPAHAAASSGVSATVIFGATSPRFGFAPCTPGIEVLYSDLTCSPCTRHGRGSCRFGDYLCMEVHRAAKVVERIVVAQEKKGS